MIKSIMLILLFGLIFSKLFSKFKLPGLLGMIVLGIIIGPYGFDVLHKSILENSSEIRTIALIIILLRAGLGIDKEILKKVGKISLKMSVIPCIFEGITIMLVSKFIFKFSYMEAGMLGFILAAVSPAVVVPFMLKLKEEGRGMNKGIPIIILAGSSIDDIFAITLFSVFLGMFTSSTKSIGMQLLNIPVEIIGGIVLGIISGIVLKNIFIIFKEKLNSLEKLCILLATAFSLQILGLYLNVSGLLGVMTLGFYLLEKIKEEAEILEKMLNKVWFFAQSFLFVLIGSAVNINVALKAGIFGIIVITMGLIGRTIGVNIALTNSKLNFKERLFCSIAYIPKATVQAAIGALPLSSGVPSGELILAVAVLAIIITAPLGSVGISLGSKKLLKKI